MAILRAKSPNRLVSIPSPFNIDVTRHSRVNIDRTHPTIVALLASDLLEVVDDTPGGYYPTTVPSGTGTEGPAGPTGPAGPEGPTGPAGSPGSPGAPGSQGVKGDTGAQGLQGLQGSQGIQGLQGDPGSAGAPGTPGATGPATKHIIILPGGAPVVWTNIPAALTEIFALTERRIQVDLTSALSARITVEQVAIASANAELRVQYSTDGGTNWVYLDNISGPRVVLGATAGRKNGAYVALVAGAKTDVLLRVVGITGDGVADPSFRNLVIEFK